MDVKYRFERIVFDKKGPCIHLSPERGGEWALTARPGDLIAFSFDLNHCQSAIKVEVEGEVDEDK